MSTLLRGKVVETSLSNTSRGGTEQMRDRLLRLVDKNLLENVAIHFSRFREESYDPSIPNILYCHDLASDPESSVLYDHEKFAAIVFVSYWQRDQFITRYNLPYSKCVVIENAIEKEYEQREKPTGKIKFIYHTTPHRGLELLYPIFAQLYKEYPNLSLDVYSSFEIYGWKQRDAQYETLFNQLKAHPGITYHGTKSNAEVLKALDDSHIFLYPSIWQETSCISLIEAVRSGCICIHPDLAALPETADGSTFMYNFHEDMNQHAQRAYAATKLVLDNFESDLPIRYDRMKLDKNSINTFMLDWADLLEGLQIGR